MAEMNEKAQALLQLMQEHPELPVIPMVDNEIVPDDTYGYYMGSFGNAEVDEYLPPRYAEEPIIFKSDWDIYDVMVKMLTPAEFDALPNDEEAWQKAYNALPWEKAIIVYIHTPED